MENWLSVREAASQVSKVLTKVETIDEAEEKLVQLIADFIDVDGVAAVRHLPSLGKIFITHTYGIYDTLLHSFHDDNEGISGYIIKYKTPLFINKETDIPPEIVGLGSYESGEKYAIIPVIGSDNNVLLIIFAIKRNRSFSPTEVATLRSMVIQAGVIYEKLLLRHRVRKYSRSSYLIANFINQHVETPETNVLKLSRNMLYLAREVIPGAEFGSILMLTPAGFRFIGQIGYDDSLISAPPIAYEHQKRWYGLSDEEWYKGVPRILGLKEIEERDTLRYKFEPGKHIIKAKATMGIPVVLDGEVKYFINFDNYTSPAAFDDVDIDTATLLGHAFAMVVSRGMEYAKKYIIKKTVEGASAPTSFTQTHRSHSISELTGEFVKAIVKTLISIEPTYILARHVPMQRDWAVLYPKETIQNISIKKIVENAISKNSSEEAIFLSKHRMYLIWFRQPLSMGSLEIAILKENFIPHGQWFMEFAKLIVGYYAAFIKFITRKEKIETLAKETTKSIALLLEELKLEPEGHADFLEKATPPLIRHFFRHPIPDDIWYGIYLHDVGKLLLPPEERENVEENISHVKDGEALLKETGLDKLEHLENMVKYHHERTDGKGPYNLLSKDIPPEAQVLSILERYHYLINKGMSHKDAIRELEKESPDIYPLSLVQMLAHLKEVNEDGR